MEATCYWEVNGVLISLNGTKLDFHERPRENSAYRYIHQGSAILSLKQAEALHAQLGAAIKSYKRLEESVERGTGRPPKTTLVG